MTAESVVADNEQVGPRKSNAQTATEMAPMFLFLSSSLNVELVYCILKGITQFGYITLFDSNDPSVQEKRAKMWTQVGRDETTLTIT